jgi:uncharacterized protein YjbI with pentapeptide repeats
MSVEASEADFSNANLSMADLRSARCDNAIFFQTNLKEAKLDSGEFNKVDFRSALNFTDNLFGKI